MEGQAERLLQARAAPLLPSWSATPLPSLSLSAGALLALADLGTVARRTALTGGASWLDALVLAPGLHYQQAADAVQGGGGGGGGSLLMMETTADDGDTVAAVRNAATVAYLERLPRGDDDDDEDTLTVVQVSLARTGGALAMLRGTRRRAQQRPPPPEIDWLSDLLYALSPLLTLGALTLMVLLGDWWGLSFLLALMLARLLNIITIRHRSRSPPPPPPASLLPTPTSHVVVITGSPRRRVILRGRADDLQAVTARAWLRPRAPADGYREAAGKLLVYGVAACGGNMTQAGVLVLAALLLVSAALLGLSNACFKGWCVHGRVARPVSRGKQDEEEDLEQGGPQLTPVEHGRGR